jgi:hypothetical protein
LDLGIDVCALTRVAVVSGAGGSNGKLHISVINATVDSAVRSKSMVSGVSKWIGGGREGPGLQCSCEAEQKHGRLSPKESRLYTVTHRRGILLYICFDHLIKRPSLLDLRTAMKADGLRGRRKT